ncbi:hypothetical protein M0804_001605 [Polistes exclamans]|nr:hypothetical protein M0804_001605 [Polistes exclamans]
MTLAERQKNPSPGLPYLIKAYTSSSQYKCDECFSTATFSHAGWKIATSFKFLTSLLMKFKQLNSIVL